MLDGHGVAESFAIGPVPFDGVEAALPDRRREDIAIAGGRYLVVALGSAECRDSAEPEVRIFEVERFGFLGLFIFVVFLVIIIGVIGRFVVFGVAVIVAIVVIGWPKARQAWPPRNCGPAQASSQASGSGRSECSLPTKSGMPRVGWYAPDGLQDAVGSLALVDGGW